MNIQSSLAAIRSQRGLSAAALSARVGVSRQTVYAMEAGDFVPNTAVALRLAQALEVSVEELFRLEPLSPAKPVTREIEMLPAAPTSQPGQPVRLCRVGKHLVGVPATPAPMYLPAVDAVVARQSATKTEVALLDEEPNPARLLIAGCDPAMSVLGRYLQKAGVEVVLAGCNSSQALAYLKQGLVHIAGTHLRDGRTGESNLPAVGKLFSKGAVAVTTFAVWEEGIVAARRNPKQIKTAADLARPDILLINRELGSGSRLLLDAELRRFGINHASVRGYSRTAAGHLPAAWQVASGLADCCIATRASAQVLGLNFLPLATERYDLVVRKQFLSLPGVQRLLETLNRAAFRRELETLGGYDTSGTGKQVA